MSSEDSGFFNSEESTAETEDTMLERTTTTTSHDKADSEFSAGVEATTTLPSEHDLEQINWETLYSTGELIRHGETTRPVQTTENNNIDVTMNTSGEGGQSNTGGWKKRLVKITGINKNITPLVVK